MSPFIHQTTHKEGQNCRGNITEGTGLLIFLILRKRVLLGVPSHNEWDGVSGMCSVWVSGLFVDHLLGITVVGGDQQDVSGILASFVYRPNGLVGGRDGLDRRI